MNTAFKFVSASGGRRILADRKIRVTQFTALNDTIEGSPNIIWPTDPLAIDKMAEFIVSANAAASVTPAARTEYKTRICSMIRQANHPLFRNMTNRMFQDSLARKFGVISLSRRFDSPLMWAHYADAHRGIALEFDDGLFGAPPMEVIYNQNRPQVSAEHGRSMGDVDYFRVKSTDWRYEDEVRYMLELAKAELTPTSDPRGHPVYVVPIDISHLRSVTFGCDFDPDLPDQLHELLKGFPEVEYFEAELDAQYFTVSRRRLA